MQAVGEVHRDDIREERAQGRVVRLRVGYVARARFAVAHVGRGPGAPLDLGDETGSDELLLDSEDILTSPVGTPPIAPPHEEEAAPLKAQPQAGTLFERMSSMARGAGKVEEEPTPSLRREPLDIPRFLNRQNNQ